MKGYQKICRRVAGCLVIGVVLISQEGCNRTDDPPPPCAVYLSVDAVTDASQCGVADGKIQARATGGQEPYAYYLNDVLVSGATISGVSPGSYTVKVLDARQCEASVGNVLVQAAGFRFLADVLEDTDCLGGNGAVTLSVNDGVPPYQFRFSNGDFTTSPTATQLASGAYDVQIKDANDCVVSLRITVPQGASGTSWSRDIQPIITNYCALSGCHNGKARQDLRVYTNAKYYAAQIKTYTKDRSMPFEGTPLTQAQIDLIGCWVDEGALNN